MPLSRTKSRRARAIGWDAEAAFSAARDAGRAASARFDRSALSEAVRAIPLPRAGHGLGDLSAQLMVEAETAARYDAAGNFTPYGRGEHERNERIAAARRERDRRFLDWLLTGQD